MAWTYCLIWKQKGRPRAFNNDTIFVLPAHAVSYPEDGHLWESVPNATPTLKEYSIRSCLLHRTCHGHSSIFGVGGRPKFYGYIIISKLAFISISITSVYIEYTLTIYCIHTAITKHAHSLLAALLTPYTSQCFQWVYFVLSVCYIEVWSYQMSSIKC
jgi:hypothetical protein